MARTRLLFVCTGNSSRSQMAEGWARRLAPEGVEIYSAGTKPVGVNPLAVEVMQERGVDISRQRSKSLAEVPGEADYVITLCAEADAECPSLPARRERLAWHLPDPGHVPGGEEEKRQAFREARDAIEKRLTQFFQDAPFSGAAQKTTR
ncbi:MAG: arsenate reductase ArsC [Candidatus Acidoferrales bacterium]